MLFVTKIYAYYFTRSLSILTDALESIVNVIAGLIGLYSLYIVTKPRDHDHPYGHGKAEFVSAAAEGALIVAAGIMIIYETVVNILSSQPLHQLDTGMILVGITAFINFIAGIFCLQMGRKNSSLALQASGRHLLVDTYSTLAIIAGLLIIYFTQLFWLDKVIALLMSLLINFNGYRILRTSLAGIMDEADKKLLHRFIDTLEKNRQANWIDLHNLRIIKYGRLLHIDCHLTLPWYLNMHEAHKEIDALTALIKKDFGEAIELFVHTDGCMPFSCTICTKTDCPVRQQALKARLTWNLQNILSDQKHRL